MLKDVKFNLDVCSTLYKSNRKSIRQICEISLQNSLQVLSKEIRPRLKLSSVYKFKYPQKKNLYGLSEVIKMEFNSLVTNINSNIH